MKRLRDEVDSNDPQLAAAGRLVEQVAPLPSSEVRASRVRRAIERKGVRRPRRRLAIVFSLLGLAGSAAAAFGVTEWLSEPNTHETPKGDPSEVDSGVPSGPKRDVDVSHSDAPPNKLSERERAQTPSAKTSQDETALVETARAPDRTQGSISAASPTGRSAASAPKVQGKQAPTLSEARLVKEAVEALRTGDDPERAERLLSQYRKNSSSGHLDEEALALTIEVALAKKSPEAARHARTYLQKYPGGKFTPLAKRALATQ